MHSNTRTANLPQIHKQRGASLLESMMYLAIAGIVASAVGGLFTGSFGSANASKTLTELTALQMGVKKLYMGQPGGYGTGSLNVDIAAAKKLPTTLRFVSPNIFNSWNSAVTITGSNTFFTVSYAGVPQDVCIEMLSSQASASWLSIQVNGAAALTPPISTAQATGATGCSAATNTIVWSST